MDKVLIRGLEISACHGVHGYEKMSPQRFIFDADLSVGFYGAVIRDDLNGTVNYSAACNLIAETAKNNTFNLIEKLAYECAFALLESFSAIKAVKLTVYKPDAPVKHKFGNVGVTVELSRETALLSLGSSIGDKKQYLDKAVKLLSETRGIKVEKVSSYITTEPYGGVAKNSFLNCAAKIKTLISPEQLLLEIHRIEKECRRVRDKRWDDRTLDIDIVFFGDKRINDETLTVPHRDYQNRDFVKIPLKQIAPHLID